MVAQGEVLANLDSAVVVDIGAKASAVCVHCSCPQVGLFDSHCIADYFKSARVCAMLHMMAHKFPRITAAQWDMLKAAPSC